MKQRLMAIIAAFAVTFACMTACGDSSSNEDASKTESSSAAETNTTSSESMPETTTATTAETTTTTQATTTVPQNKNRVVLDVKNIQQKPELPKGSEITCATMVLNYYGFNVSKMDMLKYLPIVEAPDANGVWVSPLDAYVGNPKLDTGYGCYNNIIKKAIRAYFKTEKITDYEVKDPIIVAYRNFNDFYNEINNGNPAIIWASNNMTDIKFSEKGWKTASDDFHYPTNAHCLVLIGYDKDKGTLIFSDPLDPKGTVEYPEKDVEKVYDQMYSMALVIHKK